MPVRDFLKSLSATYRNCCPGLSETRTLLIEAMDWRRTVAPEAPRLPVQM